MVARGPVRRRCRGDRARVAPRGIGGRRRRARRRPAGRWPPIPDGEGVVDRARAALLRRVGRGGGRGGPRPGARRCPRPPSCPRCAGATSSARSTWAWPRAPSRAGSASSRAGSGSPPPGAPCRRRPGLDTAGILASMAGEPDAGGPGVTALDPAGRRPAERLPRSRRGREGAVGRPLHRGGDRSSLRVGRRLRRRRAALRRGPRAPGHDDQHRRPGEPARARS